MSKSTIFTGSGVALVTPMHPDGSVNFEKYRELIDWQIENGTDAIIACGTTGESATLNDEEHLETLQVAIEQTAGRVPLIAGTGSNNTDHAIMMSKEAAKMGADGLLLVTPYYNKTSQKGLVAHFSAIADATDLPAILYNVPSRTGVNIQPATVAEIYRHPNVAAIKEASGDLSAVAKIRALCDIDVYSGNDDQTVPFLSLGAKGVISVLADVAPRQTHEICQRWFDGDIAGSTALFFEYLDLANDLFLDVNPIPVKEALNQMGWEVGPCRLPLVDMGEGAKAKLAATLKAHGLI